MILPLTQMHNGYITSLSVTIKRDGKEKTHKVRCKIPVKEYDNLFWGAEFVPDTGSTKLYFQ